MNIGSLSEKSLEILKILRIRQTNITYIQETKWVDTKERDVDAYKLWYSGSVRHKNRVVILVDE